MMKRLAVALLALSFVAILSPAQAQLSCPDPYSAGGANCTPITVGAAGTIGAVVGTLAAPANGRTTYLCGFSISAIGGTASVGPIAVAGIIGANPFTYQMASSVAGSFLGINFLPCIPASAPNTAITITTTADGSANAVDVNAWGYQR